MRKKRICIDITNVVPGKGGTGGGILTYAINLVTYLNQTKDAGEFEIYCLKNAGFTHFPDLENIKTIDIQVNNSNLLSRLYWLQVRLPFFCLKHRIDILHRSIAELPFISVCLYIATLHDFMFDFYLSNKHLKQYLTPKEILKFRFLNFINTLAVKRSDYIIVPSCSVKKEVEEKFFGKSDKVKVTKLASDNTEAIAKTQDDKSEFVRFGTVAGFYPHKGHLKVLQLANTFRKVGFTHFRFYFRGSHVYKNYVEEIRARIKELQLEEFIMFEPYEPNTTLQTIYEKYDVVVLLPEYEGFGLPVLEAQANSSVVVCSDIPVLREVLGESAMYLDINSLENDAEELVLKLNSRHHLDQMVIAGKKNVQRFSWSKTGEQTLKVYQSAIC